MKSLNYYDYSIGTLGITEDNGAITHVYFGRKTKLSGYKIAETPLIQEAAAQLRKYFDGERIEFNLPLAPLGTPFQRTVWKVLQTIPTGEIRSYQDIAVLIERPQAAQAVGMANHRNPIAIIIPCHRVIGKNGNLTGYAGGLNIKRYLLDLEKNQV
ncbi:MAG: methylated-DNA--[protein]-cysteine S-methyltransferase [Candidatus Adiutrix intracellularis]|nr:methylated-DNA--[protein]-cysteine S-methyltransferase [Candidatus Adiutrix intracellularis]